HWIEQQQLKRFTGVRTLRAEFDLFCLRSVDPAYDPSHFARESANARSNAKALEYVQKCEQNLLDRRGFNLPSRLLSEILLGNSKYVIAAFRNIKEDKKFPPTYFYAYDPYAHENIQFYQYRPKRIGQPFYTVCSYPLGDYLQPPPENTLRITQYNGWIKINPNGRVHADLGADIYTGRRKPRVIYLRLSNILRLNFITNQFGDTLNFIQEEKEAGFTVFFPDTATARDTLRLFFSYEGELMSKNSDGNWYLKDRVYWTPRLGYFRRARYKIIFKYPRRYQVISIGRLVKDWYENNWHLSYFVHSTPAKASIFAMGDFRKQAFWGPDSVYIELYGRQASSEKAFRKITADVANSLFLFSKYLTPYKYKSLKIIEAPRLDSQGFPGFINLTWVSFKSQYHGAMEALRSHEVAHQWWGNYIGWRTYRDQWLSEGFAEYMGALFLALALPSTQFYKKQLQAWCDDILEGGNIGVSLGLQEFGFSKRALRNSELEKSGPIYLGYRIGQREPADYYLSIYEKGAYVLHMLRQYLIDDQTESDEQFWTMLNEFLKTWAGRDPSTLDFIRFVNDFTHQDLTWFFNQWVLGDKIPSYEYSYRIIREKAGFQITGTVLQKEVPDDFRAYIPVLIYFNGHGHVRRRIKVQGRTTHFRFGPFEWKPQNFVFNADNAILAKIKNKN
ncbi:MAG: hypothetical protein D6814_09760, partial [Calditrichaeota bacterium]